MQELLDSRGSGTHPGNPTYAQLVAPVARRFLHPLDPRLMGVSARLWNPTTGREEDVPVLGIERPEPDRPLFAMILLGPDAVRAQASLLCLSQDGAPAPRFRFERVALYNEHSGRAVVFDEDGMRYMVEGYYREGDLCVRVEPMPETFHLGMWLQPAEAVMEPVSEPAPFPALQRRIGEKHAVESLLFSFTHAIDAGYPADLRTLGGTELERQLASYDAEHVAQFRKILLRVELPSAASTRDAPMLERGAALLAEVVAKWGHRPREATTVPS